MSDLRELRPDRCYLCGAALVHATRRVRNYRLDHNGRGVVVSQAKQVLAYDAVGVFAPTPAALPHVSTCPRRGLLTAVTA